MEQIDYSGAWNKLDQAKFLLMDTPGCEFFSNMITQTRIVVSDRLSTAWTTGLEMGFNPKFIERCTGEELLGTMLHEIYHDILDHVAIGIEFSLDMDAHNEATDHFINLQPFYLNGRFKLPHFINYYQDKKYIGWSSMKIYNHIVSEKEKGGGSGGKTPSEGGGFGADLQIPDTGDAETRIEKAEYVRGQQEDRLIRAVIQTQMDNKAGSIPAEVMRVFEDLVAPKLPWYTILQNYMNSYAKDDWTYRRPNRRALCHGMYLPDMFSQHIGELHIGIDVSCSMSDNEVNLIRAECEYIRILLQPHKMHVMSFDTEVHECGYVGAHDPFPNIDLIGGGGTNVQPCLDLIREKHPQVALIFTDGDFSPPDVTDLSTDIFWILTERPHFQLPGVVIDLR